MSTSQPDRVTQLLVNGWRVGIGRDDGGFILEASSRDRSVHAANPVLEAIGAAGFEVEVLHLMSGRQAHALVAIEYEPAADAELKIDLPLDMVHPPGGPVTLDGLRHRGPLNRPLLPLLPSSMADAFVAAVADQRRRMPPAGVLVLAGAGIDEGSSAWAFKAVGQVVRVVVDCIASMADDGARDAAVRDLVNQWPTTLSG